MPHKLNNRTMPEAITDYTLEKGKLTTFVGEEVHEILFNVDTFFEAQMHISEQNNNLFNQFLMRS
tara:strand:- start:775 stop:969 length:195 start_codon:yes stop_codon:yes gene_type:complete